MQIPKANPIRFNSLPPQRDGGHWYFQKFQRNDVTTIQILISYSDPYPALIMLVYDVNDIRQQYTCQLLIITAEWLTAWS
jgi:hypothetical protein